MDRQTDTELTSRLENGGNSLQAVVVSKETEFTWVLQQVTTHACRA